MARKAFQQPFKYITVVPKVDLSTYRYKAVNVDSTTEGVVATAAGVMVGILQGTDNINEPAQVMTDGVSFYVGNGATVAGTQLEVGVDGALRTLAAGIPVGICLVGAADTAIGCVLLK